ncbi:unnamed protein product [Periconia digitata]|uniref:Uncharacterized protein n=1 Tax=Periconia digitata TaxID=1303443 RepID=A0A9W4URQ3_9PLEO|nr:unnamed protein product [Periconia digitata]
MLPPRLLRPLRPCYRPRPQSPARIVPVRQATDNSRGKLASSPDDASHDGNDRLSSSTPISSPRPYSKKTENPVCVSCHHQFRSPDALRAHRLLSDACINHAQPGGYICRACFIPLPQRAQAQAHARENPDCAARIYKILDPKRTSVLEPVIAPLWVTKVSQCATAKYRQIIQLLVETSCSLYNEQSPHMRPILDKINVNLHQVRNNALGEGDGSTSMIFLTQPLLKRSMNASVENHRAHNSQREVGTQLHDNAQPSNSGTRRVFKHPPRRESINSTGDRNKSSIERAPAQNQDVSMASQVQLLSQQVQLLSEKLDALVSLEPGVSKLPNIPSTQAKSADTAPVKAIDLDKAKSEGNVERQIPIHHTHTGGRLMRSPNPSETPHRKADDTPARDTSTTTDPRPANPGSTSDRGETVPAADADDQSLLRELFPEAYNWAQPHYSNRNPYPKLTLPNETPLIRRTEPERSKTDRERFVESFQNRTDQLTALQLLHTSLELTEADFRRIIPKGKHIESWASEGEFVRVIPGRDPISLERLPFYYIVFRTPEAALAYQNNASRLHKLCQLHQPSSILSAIPPPRGFIENGEDLGLVTSSYLLKPAGTPLNLNMVMKPYNPSLDKLIEQGGYTPIVQSLSPVKKNSKTSVFKVLLKIEGHEPLPSDIYKVLRTDAYSRGLTWPFHNEEKGIRRLRDVVDLKAKVQAVSSDNPRAWNANKPFEDADLGLENSGGSGNSSSEQQQLNQMLMNRVYNRWLIEFEDEQAARRFARIWNMRSFPLDTSPAHWMGEGQKMCETEFLW